MYDVLGYEDSKTIKAASDSITVTFTYRENIETRNKGKGIPYQVQTSFIMKLLIGGMRWLFMQNCPQCARVAACKGNDGKVQNMSIARREALV